MTLDRRVVLITGGCSGIGAACCDSFAAQGALVIAADVRKAPTGKAGQGWTTLELDVTDPHQWRCLIEDLRGQYGRLDALVNSAGLLAEGTVEDTPLDLWRRVMAVNLNGTFFGCQAAIPLMREGGGGAIVNLSSVSGIKADAELAAYDAAKGAVRLLTKEIALFCARRGDQIRCNSVHPGIVDTPMVANFFQTAKISSEREWTQNQPIGRKITPQEVANLIVWLCSSEASFSTGAEYIIDGGTTA
ncbi:SDR family oxidoreductase [Mesorhizobium qingshengii]|uniref:NAD(P)-dependent dehydrogenase, short-chain alcohol dehydrogenase family n=1 Tax=Mesorhizobium qingshengii TaxID=1165689 RepID=A0A1G5ZWQ0_9HYPH|nr:SDR family oxidoreductase [Mesorhizobium qingshengii]SDA98703.1 NAD(P)-dependent dehydrogenase, short-chain alcohol dehydrogenase family [Mesorhizobium qingshengii]